jgi:cellulose synthase/poly-beta-1,6-N-acetylglucosamine synthase-like glycosyltransferase
MMYDLLHIFFIVLFIYLVINILYLFFIALAGRVTKQMSPLSATSRKKFAVLITSYKEDEIIVNTVQSALEHNYPHHLFNVFVAADNLQRSTIERLKELPAFIYEVNFEIGSKARSLNFLLNKIDENKYDIALVLDADNIMMPGFIDKVNVAFQNGAGAVQGHRSAKNVNSPIAVLDAISEEVNNHLFRRSLNALGLSSSLIGSGMAFGFSDLKKIYNKPGIVDNPACDREVDFELMKHNIAVKYLDDAYVLDEKVASKKVYENQRRRWLESQIIHLRLFFSGKEKIEIKTADYWNKLFINLIPPRSLFLVFFLLIFLVVVTGIILHINFTGIPVLLWVILFLLYFFTIILSIPGRFFTVNTAKSFLHLPSVLLSLLKAGFTMRSGRKEFVHTPKSFVEKKHH